MCISVCHQYIEMQIYNNKNNTVPRNISNKICELFSFKNETYWGALKNEIGKDMFDE